MLNTPEKPNYLIFFSCNKASEIATVTTTKTKNIYSEMFITAVTAAAVPQMAPLLCLFSAVTISTVMLLIPVLIETATKWEESDSRTRLFLAFKNVFLLLLWLMILVNELVFLSMVMFKVMELGRNTDYTGYGLVRMI